MHARQGYSQSAQTPYALDNLRWIADYIVKLHYADVEFCAQARSAHGSRGEER